VEKNQLFILKKLPMKPALYEFRNRLKVKGKGELIKKLYLDLFLWLPNDILLKLP